MGSHNPSNTWCSVITEEGETKGLRFTSRLTLLTKTYRIAYTIHIFYMLWTISKDMWRDSFFQFPVRVDFWLVNLYILA